ncbi:hypothetical protein [Spiroplasma eriocheiris]|uniref:Thiaminase-2/PQQC domain-containing protein n=1 Tax=Spiroplasma eriocheiris TaxID=315358 RepID=A0A0H3XGU7_9MOLU|nr:hypothetical protein [Spiroplasma eriocheiris]AHF57260.1 putative transcription activator [Spiroplasma eriocheiris CCTCC M 207170]AKM53723.1 hypothetical protein SERIO_v1c01260 [Spiroplasma eriocheiris]
MTKFDELLSSIKKEYHNFLNHPFIIGIVKNEVTRRGFDYFINQNYYILVEVIRIWGSLLVKANNEKQMVFLIRGLNIMIKYITQINQNYQCQELKNIKPSQITIDFINYLWELSLEGTYQDLIVAFGICSFGHYNFRQLILDTYPDLNELHPYYWWLLLYINNNQDVELQQKWVEYLNQELTDTTAEEMEKFKVIFYKVQQFENNFLNDCLKFNSYK